MKAESFIYTGAQRPTTMFGLPPLMFGITMVLTFAIFGIFIAAQLMALSLPAALLTLTTVWIVLFRRQRRDHHFANEIMVLPTFWRKPQTRTLITGTPPLSKKGARV